MATHYDLTVTYAVTPADDIDILNEGTYARDRYDSPTGALGDLASFIRDNGGRDAWSETDPYEVGSCWLPYGEGIEISYSAWMDRVTVVEDQRSTPSRTGRQPALVTWGRLNAASFGALRSQAADRPTPDEELR
jgi:hypothetical protein